ncbi:ATP-dependent DNA helicase RecQ [Minicystis rosea]|nr:ATP-dependent DNA helicase RecQ [Minicystis rosea]
MAAPPRRCARRPENKRNRAWHGSRTGRGVDPIVDILRGRFGIQDLRSFQRDAVEALLGVTPPGEALDDRTRRVLLVAPTGGGKSLCYQLPAALLPGTALVLSPLISLMEDQVRALSARGIAATFLASTLPRAENARRLAEVRRGAVRIVYAAPERLLSPGFLEALGDGRLSLVAVDEAHCIVQWGHDFRPDYLRIGEALSRLDPPRVIACTATATPEARAEIARALGWQGKPFSLVLRGFARPNLHLAVRPVSGPREAHLEAVRALVDALGSPEKPSGAAIVYTATRRGAEVLARKLVERGFAAVAYHAGLDAVARARISEAFAARSLPVVVATNAFGMGIDRPDVRIVVHAQPAASVEGYYQEVGRAGRDGREARGLLLISGIDLVLRRRLCALGEGSAPASPEDAARAWDRFRALLAYVDAATCRHDFILRHFGDEAESLGGCGHCDVCLTTRDPAALDEDRDTVRRALAGVARARGAAGLSAIAAMLIGDRSRAVLRLGLEQLSTFGALAGRPVDEVMGVLRVLLANGWIDFDGSEIPLPRMTPLGWKVARGDLEIRVVLPSVRRPEKKRHRERFPHPLQRPANDDSPAPRSRDEGRHEAPPAGIEPPRAGEHRSELAGTTPAATPSSSLDPPPDPHLLAALRAHRSTVARALGVPPYVVAHERTLVAIATARPHDVAALLACHGMGPKRVAAHGDGLLAIVRAHEPTTAIAHEPVMAIAHEPVMAIAHEPAMAIATAVVRPGTAALGDLAYARFWQHVQRQ